MPRKKKAPSAAPSPILAHVHETSEAVAVIELSPPHPPREETPEYAAAHHFLVHEKKQGCAVCHVNVDTLGDPARNPFHAQAIETHHHPIERSLAAACDPLKVHQDYPQVYNLPTLWTFVDSPANLLTLCDIHHRSLAHGIHHLLPQDFDIQKYLRDGYIIAAEAKDAAVALATDEALARADGLEPASSAPVAPLFVVAAPTSAPAEAHSSPLAGDAHSSLSHPGPAGSAPPVVAPARQRPRAPRGGRRRPHRRPHGWPHMGSPQHGSGGYVSPAGGRYPDRYDRRQHRRPPHRRSDDDMAQQGHPGQQQRPTGLDALISMVADLGRKQEAFQKETTTKLDAFRADWDDWREEMPNNYPPRREIDQKITAMERDQADHETRIRQIEAQLPNVRFDAYRETTVTREQALTANTQTQAKVAEERKELDARAIALYSAIVLALLTVLLNFLMGILPHLAYKP